jgi:concanavalin A-like lectin/glucanase superfamily protein
VASYAQTVLADSPSLYVRFEETAGATCADSSTNAASGTAHGTFTRNVATGLAGLDIGISLGGAVTDYVSFPNSAAINNLFSVAFLTYEAWIKPTSLPTAGEIMAGGYVDNTHTGANMYVDNTGTVFMTDAFFGGVYAQSTAGAISANTLYQVVVAVQWNTAYTVYINGVSNNTGSPQARTPSPTGQQFCIGATNDNGTVHNAFPGLIDECSAYPALLSGSQVAAHYAARNTGSSSGGGTKSPPGQTVAVLAHERNSDRHQEDTHPQRHRISDYQRKKAHG